MAYVETWSWSRSHILKAAYRNTEWLLSAGSSTSFVDAWTAAAVKPYIIKGVKVLYVQYALLLNTNGVIDYGAALLRRNGETVTDTEALIGPAVWGTNAIAGNLGNRSCLWVPCDSDGIIEYQVAAATTDLYMSVIGFGL